MVERWVASAWLLKEKNLPKSMAIEICGRWPRSWAVNLWFSQSQEKLA
jgi:hypothetical protein